MYLLDNQYKRQITLFIITYSFIESYVICLRPLPYSATTSQRNVLSDMFDRQLVIQDCWKRLRDRTSRNVALTGAWGAGKSFVMHEVFTMLVKRRKGETKEEDPVVGFYINPWHLHSIENIQESIINGIYRSIRPQSCFSFPLITKFLKLFFKFLVTIA